MQSVLTANRQIALFEQNFEEVQQPTSKVPVKLLDLDRYDKFLINISAGKDSVASTLKLLKMGIPKEKIELHHMCIDGGPDERRFFDWPVTEAYTKAFAKAFDLPLYFSWRKGGIHGELYKQDAMSQEVQFVRDTELTVVPTKFGSLSTRRRWPAKSGNLMVRWCSPTVKIDVFSKVMTHTFKSGNYAVLTGERREESPMRNRYLVSENDRGNSKSRLVHRWRNVIDLKEAEIWDLFAEFGIEPHPAYHLGYWRVSCMICIFSGPDHWATLRQIDPERFKWVVETEKELGHTIDNKLSVTQMADKGRSFIDQNPGAAPYIAKALSLTFAEEDILIDKSSWKHPVGAFQNNGGGAL